ncbi:hypothetical protein [Candidatus Symbiothrix dinenymphae]|uniref:hypothetical protein n=1 Tax=Candidatus Symbiothrix dinenymphae TaxID=467085 RepID=UPI000A8A7930|nr:hypothetical protein [Candidatus Symbiothrix dinenymphae]
MLGNTEWEEAGLGQVVVARQHANGNLTYCSYLADLKCLGVKETVYEFNIPPEKLEKHLTEFADVEFVPISYELAHNIIYAAIEYAEKYGFKPHKDFAQTTRFLLEEDRDDIPLIDIPCGGKDGKPLYVNPGREAMRAKFSDFRDEVLQMSREEQKAWFLDFAGTKDMDRNRDLEYVSKLVVITHLLAKEYAGDEAIEKYKDELSRDLDYPCVPVGELPNEFFAGVPPRLYETINDLFQDTIAEIAKGKKEGQKAIEAFRKEVGEAPVVATVEISYYGRYEPYKNCVQILEKYRAKYPDNFFVTMAWNVHLCETHENVFQRNINIKNVKTLLSKFQTITDYERKLFLSAYSIAFFYEAQSDITDKLARIIAFESYLTPQIRITDDSDWLSKFFELEMETLFELFGVDGK